MLEVLQDLRNGQGEREGRQRQVEALQTEGRPAEQEADDEAQDPRDGDGPRIPDIPAVDHDRGRIGADRVKRPVPEGDLAVEAGQHVQAEQGDSVDQDLGELEDAEGGQPERQGDGHGDHQDDPDEIEGAHRGGPRSR